MSETEITPAPDPYVDAGKQILRNIHVQESGEDSSQFQSPFSLRRVEINSSGINYYIEDIQSPPDAEKRTLGVEVAVDTYSREDNPPPVFRLFELDPRFNSKDHYFDERNPEQFKKRRAMLAKAQQVAATGVVSRDPTILLDDEVSRDVFEKTVAFARTELPAELSPLVAAKIEQGQAKILERDRKREKDSQLRDAYGEKLAQLVQAHLGIEKPLSHSNVFNTVFDSGDELLKKYFMMYQSLSVGIGSGSVTVMNPNSGRFRLQSSTKDPSGSVTLTPSEPSDEIISVVPILNKEQTSIEAQIVSYNSKTASVEEGASAAFDVQAGIVVREGNAEKTTDSTVYFVHHDRGATGPEGVIVQHGDEKPVFVTFGIPRWPYHSYRQS